jgi:Na+-driven multidrug efflux pump
MKISFVVLIAIIMGIAMSYSLVYISKFKEYMIAKKQDGKRLLILIDLLWRILIPITFGVISLIMPSRLLCFFIKNGDIVKSLSSIYLYTFIFCFFLSAFILVKLGKIKINNKLEQNQKGSHLDL